MIIKNIHKYLGFIITLLCILGGLSSLAIDTYVQAMPEMAAYFGVNIRAIKFTVTFYYLGYALGGFFGGPLSDSFGRKPITLIGIIIYGIASILIALVHGVEWLLFFRLIQGFGGGFSTVTTIIFIHDWFKGKQMVKFTSLVSTMKLIAPLFAPTIGYFLIHFMGGWKGVFYFLFIFASILFLLFLLIPESLNQSLVTNKITVRQLLKKYKVFFSYQQPVLILFSVSFSMAGIYIFVTEASFIYITYFNISKKLFPLLFAGNVILCILVSLYNVRLLKFYSPQTLVRLGLLIQLAAGIALFFIAQLNYPPFWIVFCLISIFVGNIGLVFGNGSAIIMGYNPQVSGSASANISLFRFFLGFLLSSIVAIFHSNSLIPMGMGMFCCAFIATILFAVAMKNSIKIS